MTIALGNNKPETLVEVERILWRAIFAISEGSQLPEKVVDELMLQLPWCKLQLDDSQRNWFDVRAPTLPPIAAGPSPDLLTQTTPPVSTSPSLPAPYLLDLMDIYPKQTRPPVSMPPSSRTSDLSNLTDTDPMDTTLGDAVPASVRDAEEMHTQEDSNGLHSTDKLTGDRGAGGSMGKESDEGAESPALDRAAGFRNDITTREEVVSTVGPSKRMKSSQSARLTSGVEKTPVEEGGGQPKSPAGPEEEVVGRQHESPGMEEDSETPGARRSERLSSKDKPEDGSSESRVWPTAQTGRSLSSRKCKGKEVNPREMSSANDSRPVAAGPPVATKSAGGPTKSALKRKVAPEVEAFLSGGSTAARPIDVDALNAVLETFPLKRELQVRNFKCPPASD